jgi:hypothetical protein
MNPFRRTSLKNRNTCRATIPRVSGKETNRKNGAAVTGFLLLIILAALLVTGCMHPGNSIQKTGTRVTTGPEISAEISPQVAGSPATPAVPPVMSATPGKTESSTPDTEPVSGIYGPELADTAGTLPALPQDGPVSITINSARKQLGIGEWGVVYAEPAKGNVYLVLDIAVKNTNVPEGFILTNSSLVVRDLDRGTVTKQPFRLRQSLRKYVDNPFTLPITVKQGETVSGQILFEMNDSINYRVNLIGKNETVIASRLVSFDNLLTNDVPVSITIHSARKVPEFNSSMPHPVLPNPGHIFLILNVTIKNNDLKDGYGFDFTSTHIQDMKNGEYARQSLNNGVNVIKNLENPITVPITIKQNGTKTGQLLFGIADSTEYRLNLIGNNKTILASRNIHVG